MSMRPLSSPDGFDPSLPLSEQAFFWVIYLESETCTDEDYAAFAAWLERDEQNETAYRESALLWRSAGRSMIRAAEPPGLVLALDRNAPNRRIRPPLRNWLAGAALLAACLGIAIVAVPALNEPVQGPGALEFASARYSTPIGEIRRVELADGSEVVLGGNTAIEVTLGKARRDAVVLEGQAYFDVMHAPDRPFRVTAGRARVEVVGTAFDVRRGPTDTTISVVEGRVVVATDGSASRALSAGEKISVGAAGQMGVIRTFDASQALGWQEYRFYFEDSRLIDLVADLNRYSQKPVELDGAGLEDLNISASFTLEQSSEMLAGLAAALSLELVQEEDRILLRRPG